MSHFVFAREGSGGLKSLPGTPVALVRSDDPAWDKLMLCVVGKVIKAPAADGKEEPKPGLKRGKEVETDITDEMRKIPHAMRAAEDALKARMKLGATEEDEPKTGAKKRAREETDRRAAELEHLATLPVKQAKAMRRATAVQETAERIAKAQADLKKNDGVAAGERAKVSDAMSKVSLPIGSIFVPLPGLDPNWRSTYYVAGRAGSGKSDFSAGIIRCYRRAFPDRPVYGVCATELEKDDKYGGLGIIQVPLEVFSGAASAKGKKGEATGNKELDLEEEFGTDGCMILFDDWDALKGRTRADVQHAIENILNLGRKMKISIVVTSHLLSNYTQTRGIIHEAGHCVFFPHNVMYKSLRYMLVEKLGMEEDMFQRINDEQARWVDLHTAGPKFMLTETRAEMCR
jgi:hypothetical protein